MAKRIYVMRDKQDALRITKELVASKKDGGRLPLEAFSQKYNIPIATLDSWAGKFALYGEEWFKPRSSKKAPEIPRLDALEARVAEIERRLQDAGFDE